MVERYVFVKLRDPADREGLAASGREVLSAVPGVLGVRVGMPADGPSAQAWDLSLAVRFARIEDVAAYAVDPGHRRWVDQELDPRSVMKKAWNFEVG